MIYQNNTNENTQNLFSNTIKQLQLGKLLRKSNIKKFCGVSAFEVFQFLLLLVFQGKNLFRFLNSKHKDQAVSKNTYYRFLNETSYNWKRFLLEWIRRNQNDQKTYGELFFQLCEDIQDMDLTTALRAFTIKTSFASQVRIIKYSLFNLVLSA